MTPLLITELTKCGDGAERAPELRVDDHRVEHRHAAAAVLLGQRHAEQAELGELLPELVGVADRVVLHRSDHVEPA